MSYKVAIGYDVPLLDLLGVNPQPRSEGVRATQRTFAGNGQIYEKGFYVELVFSALADAAMYRDILDQFNLSTYPVSQVTIAVRGPTWATTRYNGTAVRPDLGVDTHWDYFPKEVVILVKNLEQLVEAA